MTSLITSAVLALALAGAATAADAGTKPDALRVNGAMLGMSLQAWKNLPPPSGPESRAEPLCSDDMATKQLAALSASGGERDPTAMVCVYASRYGSYVLPQSLPLTSRYRKREPRFLFVDGQLKEIRYLTSPDAFSALVAQMDAAYGPAISTLRDTQASTAGQRFSVRKRWRTASGTVEIVDPAPDRAHLLVRVTSERI
jgi:hypothetical protein